MASTFHKGLEPRQFSGEGLKIVIVHTRWNAEIVDALVSGAQSALKAAGATVVLKSVPGAFELPLACHWLMQTRKYDACIAVGVLIKGSTMHFEYIADACSHGLVKVGLDSNKPVIFGVLTCLTEQQAKERAGMLPDSHNHGDDWAASALEMCQLAKDCF